VNTYIVELLHVDEWNQEFTVDLFIREYWVEPRLTFVPKPNIGSTIHVTLLIERGELNYCKFSCDYFSFPCYSSIPNTRNKFGKD